MNSTPSALASPRGVGPRVGADQHRDGIERERTAAPRYAPTFCTDRRERPTRADWRRSQVLVAMPGPSVPFLLEPRRCVRTCLTGTEAPPRERSQTFATKSAARQWLASVETSKARDEWIDPKLGKKPCGAYIDSWVETKADVDASTKLNIEDRIRKHIRPFFEEMAVSPVRPADARTFVGGPVGAGLALPAIGTATCSPARTRPSPKRSTRRTAKLPRPRRGPASKSRFSRTRISGPEGPLTCVLCESGRRDSNPRPQPWQGCALPAEPRPRRPTLYKAHRRATPTATSLRA